MHFLAGKKCTKDNALSFFSSYKSFFIGSHKARSRALKITVCAVVLYFFRQIAERRKQKWRILLLKMCFYKV